MENKGILYVGKFSKFLIGCSTFNVYSEQEIPLPEDIERTLIST